MLAEFASAGIGRRRGAGTGRTGRPLPLLSLLLSRTARRVARARPELFDRLGRHGGSRYLLDATDLPFVLLLVPDPARPRLTAHRRGAAVPHDARIAGRLLALLDMIDGRLDGDALFFSRALIVEGDTEAVVTLRNALDDCDGSVADDIAAAFGPLGRAALAAVRRRGGGA